MIAAGWQGPEVRILNHSLVTLTSHDVDAALRIGCPLFFDRESRCGEPAVQIGFGEDANARKNSQKTTSRPDVSEQRKDIADTGNAGD